MTALASFVIAAMLAPPATSGPGGVLVFVEVFLVWILSLCLHEYCHARVAYAGGDTTVGAKGYLSLNPFRYMDPVNSLVWPLLILFLGGIGLPGGAVWIDVSRIRTRGWLTAVSLAGPAANLALCAVLGLPFLFGLHESGDPSNTIWGVLAYSCFLQATAFMLNMLPLPGLDGYGALAPWMPYDFHRAVRPYARHSMLILLILFMAVPKFNQFFFSLVFSVLAALDVPGEFIVSGDRMFRFWRS